MTFEYFLSIFDNVIYTMVTDAPVAESVDALDLKSNRVNNSVPVQVWPGANLKGLERGLFFCQTNTLAGLNSPFGSLRPDGSRGLFLCQIICHYEECAQHTTW